MDKGNLRTTAEFIELFKNDPLRFEPGEDRFYSNAGYTLLGAIIESTTGADYAEYMRKNVFEPAGMTATGSLAGDDPPKHMATGYTRRPWPDQLTHHDETLDSGKTWELRTNVYQLAGLSGSGGGGYSTAEDLGRFANALREDRLLPAAWTQWTLGGDVPQDDVTVKPTLESYPMAAGIGVAGGAPGINALLELYLNPAMDIVILANMDPPIVERMGRQIRGWVKRAGLLQAPEAAASK
jgi:CubicO group peptidase (beta-lactamase class C family)